MLLSIIPAESGRRRDSVYVSVDIATSSGVGCLAIIVKPIHSLSPPRSFTVAMSIEQISTDDAYASSAPLSQAVKHDGRVYVSGAVPIDPETEDLVEGGVGPQTRMVMENIEAILEEAGSSMDQVLRTRIFLTDMDAFGEMNEVYEEFLSEPYPARTAVKGEMASPEILVEIDVTAVAE